MLDIGVSFAYNPSINKVSFLMIVSLSFSVFGSIINKGGMMTKPMRTNVITVYDFLFFWIIHSCNNI